MGRSYLAGLVAIAAFASADIARAEDAEPPGAVASGVSDESDTEGPEIALQSRPTEAPGVRVACSFRDPLCVHGEPLLKAAVLLETLASAERAYETMTNVLELPPPEPDLGTGKIDLFLRKDVRGGAAALPERRVAISAYDRVSAFLLVDDAIGGCARDAALTRAIARAGLWGAAPATDDGTAEAETAYVARLVVPCAMGRVDGVDLYQSDPARAIPDAALGAERARGSGLFYWWLDYSFGAAPGSTVLALWALAPTATPRQASRWSAKPTMADVLTASFKNALMTGSTVSDLWADFAVARAFAGDADDGAHLPESRSLGAAGRVRHAWDLPWPERPRSVASAQGVAPTGATYLAISHEGAPAGARLRVEIAWEEHAMMRWRAVKLDDAAKEIAEVSIEGPRRGTSAQITLVDLDKTQTILLVGTNVGDTSRAFTPDDGTWEPHGWTVSFAVE